MPNYYGNAQTNSEQLSTATYFQTVPMVPLILKFNIILIILNIDQYLRIRTLIGIPQYLAVYDIGSMNYILCYPIK